ncbi:MAG: cobalamin B12-binding domain-containing protein [Filifactoraceae bacterium]
MQALEDIVKIIVEMREDEIERALDKAIRERISMENIYKYGLNKGILEATKLYESKEYYIPEMIVCADTLNKGIEYIKKKGNIKTGQGPTLVIGVVEGDMHEIGKNIVKILMEASDYNVIDLGVNVKMEDFIKTAVEKKAKIVGLSSMMTTTMIHMKDIVKAFKNMDIDNPPKIIIGGGCVSQNYADEILADGYSENAIEAVKLVQNLLGE